MILYLIFFLLRTLYKHQSKYYILFFQLRKYHNCVYKYVSINYFHILFLKIQLPQQYYNRDATTRFFIINKNISNIGDFICLMTHSHTIKSQFCFFKHIGCLLFQETDEMQTRYRDDISAYIIRCRMLQCACSANCCISYNRVHLVIITLEVHVLQKRTALLFLFLASQCDPTDS